MPGGGQVGRSAPQRIVWPDAAKAACIVLVVLFHTTTKHYGDLPWDVPDRLLFLWSVVTVGLRPIRMPLFFLISGWFAARALRRPLREVFERRVATHYWVYLVWLLLTTAFFAVGPSDFPVFRADDLSGLLLALVLGWTSMWYLYALPVYFLLARCTVRLPLWVSLALAVLAALAADAPFVPGRGDTDGLLANFLFFVIGARAPQTVQALVSRSTIRLTSGVALVYAAALAAAVKQDADRAIVVSTVLGLLGAGLAVLAFVQFAEVAPRIAQQLSRLGRHTLPIYVLHMPLLGLLDLLADRVPLDVDAPGALPFVVVYPLLATGLLTVLCLGLHRLLLRCGLQSLFTLPTRGGTTPAPPTRPEHVH